MEQMYLSFLLTSFLIGMLILILLEKRKTPNKEERLQPTTLRNTTDAKPDNTQDIKSTTELDTPKALIEEEKVTEKQDEVNVKPVLKDVIRTTSSSSSSSSSGEEEVVKVRVPRKPKKHACKGSVVTCATKRKVTAVTIVTDSEEEEVKASLDDLAGEIRTQGVTCDVHPAFTHLLNPLSNEPSHLLLLFGTTSKGCERLRDSLRSALGGAAALPTPQPFLYSVTCWSAAAAGEVFESAVELSASLGSCGGAEWLPVTCITTLEGEDTTQPPVMAREQYVKTVMDKITKPGKKCCGTTCGSKTVDIEDLASSLLLPRAAVTS